MRFPTDVRKYYSRALGVIGALSLLIAAAAIPVSAAHRVNSPTAAIKAGGNVSFNLGVVLDCADAARSGELASLYVVAAMADTLITQDSRGNFVGDLATKWTFSHGGKWLTFTLRPGMKFSNGHAVDATAVRFNLLRKENAGIVGPIQSVQVISPVKLIMKLSAPFRPELSNLAFLLPVYDPASITKNDCQSVIGSGPFKISSVGPGFSSITMTRNTLHTWTVAGGQNKGLAHLATVTFKGVTDPSTSVSELISGALDIAGVAGTQLSRVQNNSKITLYRKLQQNITWMGFNTSHAPFNKPAVRKAIAESVDRNAVIAAALNGQGKPAYSMVPPSIPFSDPKAGSYAPKYNPTAAKQVLAANHVTGPYTLLGFTGVYAPISEIIQAQLAQVGVKITVVNKPLADYFPAAAKGAFDLNILSYSGTDPDILYTLFDSSQETATGANYTFYKNATLDNLLVQGREATSTGAATKAYNAAQKYIDTKVLAAPLYVPYGTVGVSSRVGGYHRNIWALAPLFQDLYIK